CARIDRHCHGTGGLDPEVAEQPLEAVLRDEDHLVALLDAGVDEARGDVEDVALHVRPGVYLPRLAGQVVDEGSVAQPGRLTEENADCRAVGYAFGIQLRRRSLVARCPCGGHRVDYLTALMVRVRLPCGTLMVT